MSLRYAGSCRTCGAELAAGTRALYEKATHSVRCLTCVVDDEAPAAESPAPVDETPAPHIDNPAPPVPDRPKEPENAAGASARREYERRRARDEQRIRERWGKLGGVTVFLSDEKQSTSAWRTGAVGEEVLGRILDRLSDEREFSVLHDRRIPGSRANIDHLVVNAAGIWVIDTKKYMGRPSKRVDGGFIRPAVARLTIGGRDGTKLIEGVLKQVGLVRELAGDAIPVTGALCFIDADWPLIGGSDFTVSGVHIKLPKLLIREVTLPSAPPTVDYREVAARLAAHFPPA